MNLEKRRSFYPVKKSPSRTMIPCPYCMTFHSVGEYARVKMSWHGEVLDGRMNVYDIEYDTGCPACGAVFQLHSHEKKLDGYANWKLVYYSIPKKSRKPLDK